MTDLQLSLIGTSAVFIVLIYIYNKWQEYRARKSVEQVFSSKHDDVLMNSSEKIENNVQRQEPGFGSLDEQTERCDVANARVNNEITSNQLLEKVLSVDKLIDCIISLEFETSQRGEKLLEEIADFRFVGNKAVHVIGINQHGEYDEISYGNSYTSIFAGVQMVNRSGPLNELEYSEFVGKLRLIADHLNADSDIPDMNRVMEVARELHHFVAEHDAQLSVNILANGAPWDITSLLVALEKQGFDIRPDGRLSMSDGDTGSLFTLSTNVSVSETVTSKLTLLLDVPCIAPNLDAFGAMSTCARMLASRLGGTVVDDGDQAISKEAVSEIAAQVADFYAAMEEAQIPAGSRRAQRLFS